MSSEQSATGAERSPYAALPGRSLDGYDSFVFTELVTDEQGLPAIVDESGLVVAFLSDDGLEGEDQADDGADEIMQARGRVMAAAPRLLYELRRLVDALDPVLEAGGLNAPGLATLNGAKLAIARATSDPPTAPRLNDA